MSAALGTSGTAASHRQSTDKELEEAPKVLKDHARAFARAKPGEKARLLRATMRRVAEVAEKWAEIGNHARGAKPGSPEEWFSGPVPTLRNLRLLAEQMEAIEQSGEPHLKQSQLRTRPDGRVEVEVYPADPIDAALIGGVRLHELMQEGMTEADVRTRQASFYKQKDPEGGVSLILGAGNVSSIPPMDALYKSFAEGYVCLVKMNPVNEWVGPILEDAFRPFIEAGYLRIVYGGGPVGSELVAHPAIEDIHITGSNHTHDLIVWGPPGPERDRRMAANDPVLKKRITSELGNVSPVCILPTRYSDKELDFVARHVAAMVAHNASFNCNAAKLLITSAGWPQRDEFFSQLTRRLSEIPSRVAYYPGAHDRYRRLTEGRELQTFGEATETKIAWTLIRGVDAKAKDDIIFSNEPFCGLISETTLEEKDPEAFLDEAVRFMNDTLWGTLNAMIVVSAEGERRPEISKALDRAILALRYGTVSINQFPGVAYGTVSPAWGGHPSATLANIQSGLGWVHNTYLLEGVEKTVLRAPVVLFPKPLWFPDHRAGAQVGRKVIQLELSPSWFKVPGIAMSALTA